MTKNIKYLDLPEIQTGMKLILFYDIKSLPIGFIIKDILELANKRQKIPYVEGKGSSPSYEVYPII